MTSEAIVVVDVSSRPSTENWLTAVPGFMQSLDPHRECLKQLFDDVTIGVVEMTAEVSLCKGGEIAYPIDKKLRILSDLRGGAYRSN